jgi:lipopolysaccharide transport system ATP-binding protein
MSDIAIHVENLSKQYRIGAHQSNRNFREALEDAFKAPFRRAGKLLRGHAAGAADLDEIIWALKDVSFKINQGETVGIIGRNGAGKSTLLKIISRITEPTEGFAEMRGRMGSLLEVGTGFHPELTGRENIYLNGAILGMKKAQIRQKFDEIVAFSEVEKFIDTPVKHYSSGMYLRLAFAVAAHLDPEILVVDEVLAVGDAQFQKKCLNKMQDVGQEGRTVLFVSHNMAAINRLCRRTILINEGSVSLDGPSQEVIGSYLIGEQGPQAVREWPNAMEAPGADVARLRAVRVKLEDGQVTTLVDIRQPVIIEMDYEVIKPGYVLLPHFELFNGEGIPIFISLDQDPLWRGRQRPEGLFVSQALIPGNLLSEGMVFVEPANATLDPNIKQYCVADAVAFQVVDSHDGNSARGDWVGDLPGVVRPLLQWNTQYLPNNRKDS